VPAHLRDAHYAGAAKIEHGKGYRYAHDWPGGVAPQQYAPDAVAGRDYYTPTDHGAEQGAAGRLRDLRETLRGTGDGS
jgi:putative ATPase